MKILFTATCLLLSSCGTMLTHADSVCAAGNRGPYSGTVFDGKAIANDVNGFLLILDLPFSLVADTLMLPADLASICSEEKQDSPEAEKVPEPPVYDDPPGSLPRPPKSP